MCPEYTDDWIDVVAHDWELVYTYVDVADLVQFVENPAAISSGLSATMQIETGCG